MEKQDYVSVIYNKKDKPITDYPSRLANLLVDKYQMKEGSTFLDLGCGRGEFTNEFSKRGLNVFGVDLSVHGKSEYPDLEIKQCDFENEALPYPDNHFDFIFSKSVFEHFYYPDKVMAEAHRILKPGGQIITMTPDWAIIYKIFYDDFTHRTPFTIVSLGNIKKVTGFKDVECMKFIQLPFVWKYPFMKYFCKLVALLTPDSLKKSFKLIRFSKEGMLLASGTK